MRHSILPLILIAAIPFLSGCQPKHPTSSFSSFTNYTSPDEFASYWFQGKAELASYDLEIVQYGESRKGDAVMIFVTEDLSRSKQVKLDNIEEVGDDRLPVLKLNKIWKFQTGIYDYSLMGSIFTPIDLVQDPYSIKESVSLQDWCGMSFHQLSREKDSYLVRQFSYFESEGDQSFKVSPDMLEDELFTRIRINPATVPTGEYDLIPGGFYLRLAHEPIKPKRARIQFLESEATIQCVVEYLHLDRTLRIHFEPDFPFRILSWTEEQGQQVVVEGKLRKTIQNAYWTKNAGEFLPLRDSLKLIF
ncbi:MAG: hypothetical protein IPL49_01295 [Saprospirales bacterium]|nr:hypothetical protein [Saprospirales bacterium]MBK8489554.1 hypothetical protein [Saprospirales bacterium]